MKYALLIALLVVCSGASAMNRKYSLDEIDAMRWSLYIILSPRGTPPPAVEATKIVEEQLRTHLLAGTEPCDLLRKANALAYPPEYSGTAKLCP